MPPLDSGPGVEREVVEEGVDAADDRLVGRAEVGDIGVTRDLPSNT